MIITAYVGGRVDREGGADFQAIALTTTLLRPNRSRHLEPQNMPTRFDEISRAIGSIETSVRELQRRADEDREICDRWHSENGAAIAALTRKLDQHAAAVEMMRPAVAALELSRSRLVA